MAATGIDHSKLPSGLRYHNKVCVVTGGASGIGAGIVRVFAQNGSRVVILDINDDKGTALADELTTQGPGDVTMMKCDVTQEENVKTQMEAVAAKFGRLDCLVNVAGRHPPHKTIDDITSADFRELLDINLIGYFLTCKYALPHLRQTAGSIINMSSLVAQLGQYAAVPYVATKGAISAMTRALAIDEAQHKVRVNCISPSSVWTPLWEESVSHLEDKESVIETAKSWQLLGRFGTSEEVGLLCLFLAADATFMTGVDVPCAGGAEIDYGVKSRITVPT